MRFSNIYINYSLFLFRAKQKSGESIVQRIEKYKKDNDTLHNSLHEMGIDDVIDDVLFCYEKVDSANYIVWFGTTLGEGIYYYSDTKKWENRLRGCSPPRNSDHLKMD